MSDRPPSYADDDPFVVVQAERDMVTSALERMYTNFKAYLAQKPVRDMAEMFAEAEAALNWVNRG